MKKWFNRIWNDPVGSSLISAGIIAFIGAGFPFAIKAIGITTSIEDAFKAVFTFKINIWLAIGIVIVIMVIRGTIQKYREKNQKVPVPPFVDDFVAGYYQGLKWEWRWQWSPECKYYYVDDLNIVCPNCHQGILNLGYMDYICVKCNTRIDYDMIHGDFDGVGNQIIQDARTKYSFCQEYIGKQPAGIVRG